MSCAFSEGVWSAQGAPDAERREVRRERERHSLHPADHVQRVRDAHDNTRLGGRLRERGKNKDQSRSRFVQYNWSLN